uniref:G-protein coupled receptors family 1 profile domain-containing protein n=1 Tax=Biomphalaria glabrata TaxID=6526 RepID=A0A2C9L895_BIOGL
MSQTQENTSLLNVSNVSSHTLEEINDEIALTLLPAMLVLAILMVVGICGNSLVVYVFCFKMKSGTQNVLIVCLAVFDLLSCTLSIPNEITDMRYFYTFPSEAACKIMRFVNTFCAIGSIMTLIVIAVDRFRKICRPFKRQMHTKHVKLSLIPVIALALFFSLPAFVMYGLRTADTHVPGLVGQDCSTPNAIGSTILPLLYNLLLFVCFIILSVTLSVLYFCILRETNRHNRYMKRNSDFSLSSTVPSTDDSGSSLDRTPVACSVSPTDTALVVCNSLVFDYSSECPALPEVTVGDINANNNENKHALNQTDSNLKSPILLEKDENSTHPLDVINTSTLQSPATISVNRKPSILISSKADYVKKDLKIAILEPVDSFKSSALTKPLKRHVRSKTTIIAFVVTVVFILSFLPHLCLQVAKMIKQGFDYNLQGSSLVAYNIFLRSYFLNSVSNPFIYSILNVKFSSEVKRLFRKMSCKT